MNVGEVQQAIFDLTVACGKAGVISINRFYFDDTVIFNVTTKDGYLASARLVKGALILNVSKRKAKH